MDGKQFRKNASEAEVPVRGLRKGKGSGQKSYNEKYKCPSPEDIVCGTDSYSFSFNPEDQPIREGSGKFKVLMYRDYADNYRELFRKCTNCYIIAQWEISRLGRFHLHGTIRIKSGRLIEFYTSDLQRLKFMGTFEIDVINDPDTWSDYCNKLKTPMEKWCKANQMQYQYNTVEEDKSNDALRNGLLDS